MPTKPKPSASTKEGAIDVEVEGSDDFSQFLDEGEFDESFNATNASFVDEFEAIRNDITSKVGTCIIQSIIVKILTMCVRLLSMQKILTK